ISNIISNAVNYTDEGKEIRIYIKDKKLIIENDCKPISEEHLAHIFEAFYRVDFDRNKSSGGNGLGLYIVQQILKMYNLDYSFKSILTGMSFEVDFN
ncbi:ATP-binding protein, partial [Clostridium cuniculi]